MMANLKHVKTSITNNKNVPISKTKTKFLLQIIMLQEIPRDSYPSSKRKCDRQNFDTSRSAELEGNIPGIHSLFFLFESSLLTLE